MIDKNKLREEQDYFRTMFQKEIGEPDRYYEAPQEIIDKYRGTLPDELIYYWKQYGFSSFKEGLFWLTNPDEYTELVEEYLAGTVFENRPNLYVVARTAFGKLYLWEKTKGGTLKLGSLLNMIFLNAVADRENFSEKQENLEMVSFLGLFDPEYIDQKDGSGKPLFERCLKKFGKVEANEMYGYKLSHFLGGKESITNIAKMDLFNHYSIQKQLQEPTISISDTENNTLTWG